MGGAMAKAKSNTPTRKRKLKPAGLIKKKPADWKSAAEEAEIKKIYKGTPRAQSGLVANRKLARTTKSPSLKAAATRMANSQSEDIKERKRKVTARKRKLRDTRRKSNKAILKKQGGKAKG